jgi:hypothetical protein
MKLLGIISVGFGVTVEKWEYNETVHQLFIDLKEAYDPLRREVLYRVQQANFLF